MSGSTSDNSLAGRTVVLLEARHLEILASLCERRGAQVIRCPAAAIEDAPDPAPVAAWLRRFIAQPPDEFVLLTGEGLKRLLDLAIRTSSEIPFRAALAA